MDQTGAWVGDGTFRDLAAWLASIGGTTIGAARGATDTARRLRELPESSDALRAGALSPVQADAVAAAATADPAAESDLLETAKTSGMRGLTTEGDRVVAAATKHADEIENYERIRAAQMMAALEPFERALFEENRTNGRAEHPDAVAFDALVQLCEQSAGSTVLPEQKSGSRPLAMVIIHMSKTAYERGWTEPGELCEIDGIGPIPVAVARRMASDAIFKHLVTHGIDITRISHYGRTIPAHLRTAVATRDRTCVIAGCDINRHLQIDHNIPVAAGGLTELANLDRLCHHHHDHKTRHDLRRTGPPSQQHFVTRDEYAQLQTEPRGPPTAHAA